mmetsp:Transcript_21092/g.44001  ORF Transcript_21092/g.44001 Transcript_21092/m.44001 type:complete len:448 (+) Transcript_21092:29-1372(+)
MAPFIAIICMFLAFPNHLKVMGQGGVETVQGSGDCPACDTAGFDALLAKEKEECTARAAEVAATHAAATKALNAKLMDSDLKMQETLVALKKAEADLAHEVGKTEKVKGELGSELEETSGKLIEKTAEVKKMNKRISELNKELADLRKELTAASAPQALGKGAAKYCNFTLMQEDAVLFYESSKERTVETAAYIATTGREKADEAIVIATALTKEFKERSEVALEKGKELVDTGRDVCTVYGALAYDFASEKYELAQPHITKATNELAEVWRDNVKPHVDEKVMPVYKDKLEPHVKVVSSMAGDAYESALPKWLEAKAAAVQAFKSVKLSCESLLQEASTAARAKLGDVKKGEGVDSVLKTCEEEPEWVVETVGKVLLALFFLRYGLGLVSLALRVALLWPIKIVFWPFFVFRGAAAPEPQREDASGGTKSLSDGRIGSDEVAKGPE